MLVHTQRLGAPEHLDVPEERIFEIYPGLGGFDSHHNFAVLVDADSPIEWLQSLSDPAVCFPMIEPYFIDPGYAIELPDPDAAAIGAKDPAELTLRAILTVRDPIEETTANLLAPIVLNAGTRLGRQIVLQDTEYPIRAPIFGSLEAIAESRPAQAA
jgi:flagellar assembly factor FliW